MVYLVLLCLIGFLQESAQAACHCPDLSAQEQQEQAAYVFTGKIFDIRTDKKTGVQTLLFDVLDSFKGNPDSEMSMTDAEAATECRTEFKEGDSYMVYAHWEWGAVTTSRCFGAKPLEAAASDAGTLGPSDEAKGKLYNGIQQMCMGRPDTPCCLASLKAMRLGYYLPEPEEGCPAGTIPDRLKCGGSLRWCIPAAEAEHRKAN